eukprot:scaffold63790_cov70-Phaeocystis_antarctica.AAC.5
MARIDDVDPRVALRNRSYARVRVVLGYDPHLGVAASVVALADDLVVQSTRRLLNFETCFVTSDAHGVSAAQVNDQLVLRTLAMIRSRLRHQQRQDVVHKDSAEVKRRRTGTVERGFGLHHVSLEVEYLLLALNRALRPRGSLDDDWIDRLAACLAISTRAHFVLSAYRIPHTSCLRLSPSWPRTIGRKTSHLPSASSVRCASSEIVPGGRCAGAGCSASS